MLRILQLQYLKLVGIFGKNDVNRQTQKLCICENICATTQNSSICRNIPTRNSTTIRYFSNHW